MYIWHRHSGSLLEVISGHASTVNSVCWPCTASNGAPAHCPWLLSASDDHTLRIWTSESAEQGEEGDGPHRDEVTRAGGVRAGTMDAEGEAS